MLVVHISCSMSRFHSYCITSDLACTNAPDETNGLWTGLVVGAESLRYLVTGEQEALDNAITYFEGMRLLNEITGITGLMARTLTSPDEPYVSALRMFVDLDLSLPERLLILFRCCC